MDNKKPSTEELLRKIIHGAKQDAEKRRDQRYRKTMGFLTAKGFLRTNQDIPFAGNKRIALDDAIWAGKNIEPRILEVLPAAVLRLPLHFDFDPLKHRELAAVVDRLRRREPDGPEFNGMPYSKVKLWVDLPLRDRRVKSHAEKKLVRTYRLRPEVVERVRHLADELGCTETEVIERRILADG